MNWEENATGGLGGTVSPSVGSVWDRGGVQLEERIQKKKKRN